MLTTVFGWWKYGRVSLLHFCNFKVSIKNTYSVYNGNICDKGGLPKHYDKDHSRKPKYLTIIPQQPHNYLTVFHISSHLWLYIYLIINTLIIIDWCTDQDVNSNCCWVLGVWVNFFSSSLLNFPKFAMSMYYICNGEIHT